MSEQSLLPTFLVIGAAKCGTTSLHRYLRQHPEIFMPKKKELHFFRREEPVDDEALQTYRHYFEPGAEYAVRGEATPAYFHWPDQTISTIREVYDDKGTSLRFILILRDPVDRMWSQYLHLRRNGTESRSFSEVVDAIDPEDRTMYRDWRRTYFQEGLYAQQMQSWLEVFDRKQFHVLLTRDLADDAPAALQAIFSFLDVDPAHDIDTDRQYNQASQPRSQLFQSVLSSPPAWLYRATTALLPLRTRRWIQQQIRSWNQKPLDEKPDMPDEEQERVRWYYRRDVRELERLLDRDLSDWYTPNQPAPVS
ncbi:sulfotransferase family protein [Salinibacter ruber]|uniref:sulfotransferase family protein n=1 Tax=Salinibacter ruber TaxID=146919 RepID=UPI002168D81D